MHFLTNMTSQLALKHVLIINSDEAASHSIASAFEQVHIFRLPKWTALLKLSPKAFGVDAVVSEACLFFAGFHRGPVRTGKARDWNVGTKRDF